MNSYSLIILALLASCGHAMAGTSSDTIVELHPNLDLDSLDPAWANDTLSREVITNIYEPLIRFKGDSLLEYEPALSEAVPSIKNGLLSGDGKTYRFPIRKGIRFHDGGELSCEDARYSLLRFMVFDRPAGGAAFYLLKPVAGALRTRDGLGNIQINFKQIAGRVACDGENLKIVLPRPYPPLLSVLAQYSQVVSKSWAIKAGAWDETEESWKRLGYLKKEDSPLFDRANGTGPFALERWDRSLKQVILKRNEAYWRKPAVIARVIIKEVAEFSVRRMMLAAGDADISNEPSPQFKSEWETVAGVRTISAYPPRTDSLFFTFGISTAGNQGLYSGKLDGYGIPPDFFEDKDVRKAFAYAFDYSRYISDALRGLALQPSGCIPPGLSGHDAQLPKYSFDLKKSEEHFRRAGKGLVWEKGFKLAVYYNSGNSARKTAYEILKKNVEGINPKFSIEIRALDWATYIVGVRQRKFPMFLLGYLASFADPDSPATAFLHSEGLYLKLQGYKNPEWDRLTDQAAFETVAAKRMKIYRTLQRQAFEESPHIYLTHPADLRVIRNELAGYQQNSIAPGTDFYPLSKIKVGRQ